ncbi:MAG: FliH/SctL family protein [Terriglobales bacterium]
MSSSAARLQRQQQQPAAASPHASSATPPAAAETSPFCYAEAQPPADVSGQILEQAAEERSRRAQAEALERGREAGRQELRASVDAALARHREQIVHSIEEFAKERSAYYGRVEGEVVQLALAIARKILHRETQLDPHLLAGIVRVTLEKLDSETKVDLHVPARETTDWRHYFACQSDGMPVPEVHEDAALTSGECRVETALGSTEVGLEAQLKEIETGLLDLLAERPTSGGALAAATTPSATPGSGVPSLKRS